MRVSFQDRVVSIGLERIARLPMVVAMAFGSSKLAAIRGALSGGFIQGLVTDSRTAESLLEDAPADGARDDGMRTRKSRESQQGGATKGSNT